MRNRRRQKRSRQQIDCRWVERLPLRSSKTGKKQLIQDLSALALKNSSELWKTLWKTAPDALHAPIFQLFTQSAQLLLHISMAVESAGYSFCRNVGQLFDQRDEQLLT